MSDDDERTPIWSAAIALGRERLADGDRSRLVGLGLAWLGALVAIQGVRHHTVVVTGSGAGILLAARGLTIGRRIAPFHIALTFGLVLLARWCNDQGNLQASAIAMVVGGLSLTLPGEPPMPGNSEQRQRIWSLVNRTSDDTLAPFALRTDKSYFFSNDHRAAIAYRVRFGTAVVSGDAIGEPGSREGVLQAFFEHAHAEGWRVAGLGVSQRDLPLWQERGFWSLSIGRDVVIDVEGFALTGRAFRNLRQAVQRTINAGVTTEIVAEAELTEPARAELLKILHKGKGNTDRGFAMILDKPLTGEHPGIMMAFARDHEGRIVAAARFASSDQGRELSLDIPWRVPGAPNGVDERLIADMITWAKTNGGRRLSLAFAAFPDIFIEEDRGAIRGAARHAIKVLDPLIKLESLFRYLRKFHAFDQHRYVVTKRRNLLPVAVTMLVLEFALIGTFHRPRRIHKRGG